MSLGSVSIHLSNTSGDGASTPSLGSLFQRFTTLSVKKFFLISSLNLLWCNLRPFPLVLMTHEKTLHFVAEAKWMKITVSFRKRKSKHVTKLQMSTKGYSWPRKYQDPLEPGRVQSAVLTYCILAYVFWRYKAF